MAIDIKAAIKPLARGIAQLPGVSRILRLPGVRKSLARLPRAGRLLANGAVANAWERRHPFDIEHGTDTSGFVAVADLEQLAHEAARAEGHPYASSQPSIIRAALTALPPLHSFSFVDIGCGKGRPLLVASEMPFSDIVGVELSASLAKTARLNADTIKERFPTRTPIRVVVGDAGRFPLPDGNVVLFLYNPFGEAIIAKVVEAVNAALKQAQRTIYVVYYNPVFGHCFDASPLLSRHSATTLPYAASERGFGPDMEDPVVVWQGGIPLGAARSGADARIEIVDPRYRVRLVPNEGRRPMAVTSPLLIATSLAFGFQTSAMD